MALVESFTNFILLWVLTYVLVFGSYLLFGFAFTWWARSHPERKIQPKRDGLKRRNKEIRASARSLIVTCGCFAGGLHLQMSGYSLFDPWALTWWSAPLMFIGSVLLFDTWFYWVHRLGHTGMFKEYHLLHHQSVAPTVWSNYSDTFFDAFTQQSFFLFMPLIVPFPPAIFIAHRAFDHFNGMIGHSGFEFAAGPSARTPWPLASVTFHDMHHSTFNYNYANHFSFWDRLMGTLHPQYDTAVVAMEEKIAGERPADEGILAYPPKR